MKISRIGLCSLVATCIAALPVSAQTPVPLVNADFEAGLNGWTVFTTANGTVGPAPLPLTTAAVINGKPASQAAMFVAGQRSFMRDVEEGGGVFQWFETSPGTITVSSDVAALFYVGQRDSAIDDSARFWLIVDGQIVSRLDLGLIRTTRFLCGPFVCSWGPGVAQGVLTGSASVGPGPHYVMIAITRTHESVEPYPAVPLFIFHFLDNVSVTWSDANKH